MSEEIMIPIIASHECLFMKEEDAFSYQVARRIDTGVKLNEPIHSGNQFKQHFIPSKEQWYEWFHDRIEWLNNTKDLLFSCTVEIQPTGHLMPKFPVGEGQTAEQLLAELAFNGLKERLKTSSPNEMYVKRLQYELEVIQSMGFADYFLIVADFHELCTETTYFNGTRSGFFCQSLSLPFPSILPMWTQLSTDCYLNVS